MTERDKPIAPAEPVIDGYPLEQGIPPAPTASDIAGVYVQSDLDAAEARATEIAGKLRVDVGVTPDLDALVAEYVWPDTDGDGQCTVCWTPGYELANDEWLKGFANQRVAAINLFLAKQGD